MERSEAVLPCENSYMFLLGVKFSRLVVFRVGVGVDLVRFW